MRADDGLNRGSTARPAEGFSASLRKQELYDAWKPSLCCRLKPLRSDGTMNQERCLSFSLLYHTFRHRLQDSRPRVAPLMVATGYEWWNEGWMLRGGSRRLNRREREDTMGRRVQRSVPPVIAPEERSVRMKPC